MEFINFLRPDSKLLGPPPQYPHLNKALLVFSVAIHANSETWKNSLKKNSNC